MANWWEYRAKVESNVEAVKEEVQSWSLGEQSEFLVDSMLSAAEVERAKTPSGGKVWITEDIRTDVKRRNLLQATLLQQSRMDQCLPGNAEIGESMQGGALERFPGGCYGRCKLQQDVRHREEAEQDCERLSEE